jgi:hypothetical protein
VRQNQACDGVDVGITERSTQRRDPSYVYDDIVICVGHDIAVRFERSARARAIEAGLRFDDPPDRWISRNQFRSRLGRRYVVHHDDFVRRRVEAADRV